MKKEKHINVIVIQSGRKPVRRTILNELETLQSIVDGYIEVISLEHGVDIICNEEGKINALPLNRALYDADGDIFDIVAGTFIVSGADYSTGEFISLTPYQADKYMNRFKYPEVFIRNIDRIEVLTLDDTAITREDFQMYEDVRKSGKTNMTDLLAVEEMSGLSKAKIITIITNYSDLREAYSD